MKSIAHFLFTILLFALASCGDSSTAPAEAESPQASARQFYQLKTYLLDTDAQVQTVDTYLKNAFLPALQKQGIGPVGVFKLRPPADSVKKIYVLIPLTAMDQLLDIDEALASDAAYQAAGSEYINASYEQPPYQRITSVLMRAFVDMPEMAVPAIEGPRPDRIYELRSYESATEAYYWKKVDMFNAGGEVKLFDRLECNAVFYAEVLSGAAMPNLMYMTTYVDQATRDAKWEAFFGSPEWAELKAMEKYKHSVSHADIIFLYPTEYSDY